MDCFAECAVGALRSAVRCCPTKTGCYKRFFQANVVLRLHVATEPIYRAKSIFCSTWIQQYVPTYVCSYAQCHTYDTYICTRTYRYVYSRKTPAPPNTFLSIANIRSPGPMYRCSCLIGHSVELLLLPMYTPYIYLDPTERDRPAGYGRYTRLRPNHCIHRL